VCKYKSRNDYGDVITEHGEVKMSVKLKWIELNGECNLNEVGLYPRTILIADKVF